MPWLDGLQFCKDAKSTDPNLKIYALSGFIGGYDPADLKAAGFDGVFQKPVRETLLIEILDTCQADTIEDRRASHQES